MAVAPATATPIPNPTIPCSQRGVLKTLSLPGDSRREGEKTDKEDEVEDKDTCWLLSEGVNWKNEK